jgi:SNF2 family DNA or RNA helicase
VPVFLLSLQAGGVGLNLTRADHVVHVDRWWNPAVEDQATDRAYRIGQTKPVQVHRLVTRGTLEERVAELLTRKRALADAVLGRGEAALTELGDDELRELVALG